MEAIFRPAIFVGYLCADHERRQTAQHILVMLDPPLASREYEIALADRTGELPHLQRRQGLGRERDGSPLLDSDFGEPILP